MPRLTWGLSPEPRKEGPSLDQTPGPKQMKIASWPLSGTNPCSRVPAPPSVCLKLASKEPPSPLCIITFHKAQQKGRHFFEFMVCRILIPWPGIKPAPPALEARSLNHWNTRGVPRILETCLLRLRLPRSSQQCPGLLQGHLHLLACPTGSSQVGKGFSISWMLP